MVQVNRQNRKDTSSTLQSIVTSCCQLQSMVPDVWKDPSEISHNSPALHALMRQSRDALCNFHIVSAREWWISWVSWNNKKTTHIFLSWPARRRFSKYASRPSPWHSHRVRSAGCADLHAHQQSCAGSSDAQKAKRATQRKNHFSASKKLAQPRSTWRSEYFIHQAHCASLGCHADSSIAYSQPKSPVA